MNELLLVESARVRITRNCVTIGIIVSTDTVSAAVIRNIGGVINIVTITNGIVFYI